MKFRFHQGFGLLFLAFCQIPTSPAVASPSKIQHGDSLIQRGLQNLDDNQPNKALQLFLEAYSIYKDSKYPQGQNGSLINQSIALIPIRHNYDLCYEKSIVDT